MVIGNRRTWRRCFQQEDILSSWAATTKYYRLINHWNLFLTVLEAEKSKVKALAYLVSSEDHLALTSRGERGQESLGPLL